MMNLTGIYNPEVHKQGDTQSTVLKTAVKKGFCTTHNDIRIDFMGFNKPCYRCEEEHQLDLSIKKAQNQLVIRELEIKKNHLDNLPVDNLFTSEIDAQRSSPIDSLTNESDKSIEYVDVTRFQDLSRHFSEEFEKLKYEINLLKSNNTDEEFKEIKRSNLTINEQISQMITQIQELKLLSPTNSTNSVGLNQEIVSIKKILIQQNQEFSSIFSVLTDKIQKLEEENELLKCDSGKKIILEKKLNGFENVLEELKQKQLVSTTKLTSIQNEFTRFSIEITQEIEKLKLAIEPKQIIIGFYEIVKINQDLPNGHPEKVKYTTEPIIVRENCKSLVFKFGEENTLDSFQRCIQKKRIINLKISKLVDLEELGELEIDNTFLKNYYHKYGVCDLNPNLKKLTINNLCGVNEKILKNEDYPMLEDLTIIGSDINEHILSKYWDFKSKLPLSLKKLTLIVDLKSINNLVTRREYEQSLRRCVQDFQSTRQNQLQCECKIIEN